MTDRFLSFMPFIVEWEGSAYEDVAGDPGGPTKYGIDSRSHPTVDIKNLTLDEAQRIYFDSYWTPGGCEEMPSGLGECHMDACVNCGLSRAKVFLSQCGNNASTYLNLREGFYRRLAQSRQSLAKFLKGWLNRTQALRAYLKLSAS